MRFPALIWPTGREIWLGSPLSDDEVEFNKLSHDRAGMSLLLMEVRTISTARVEMNCQGFDVIIILLLVGPQWC